MIYKFSTILFIFMERSELIGYGACEHNSQNVDKFTRNDLKTSIYIYILKIAISF